MRNLIDNPSWRPGPAGGPEHFTNTGPITHDAFSLGGFYSCSLSMPDGSGVTARSIYDPAIEVAGARALHWGVRIRAIESGRIQLAVEFYDRAGALIESARREITPNVGYQFSRQAACFPVPAEARNAYVALELSGKTTGCTFLEPLAYLE